MNRRSFVLSAAAFALSDCSHSARRAPFFDEIAAARTNAKTLVIRHLEAYVTTRVRVTVERLAAMKPVGTTHDTLAIAEAFGAILDAKPRPASTVIEPRWHLTFLDRANHPIFIVTSSIFSPHTGSIGGRNVAFANTSLLRFLSEHYAPDEVQLTVR